MNNIIRHADSLVRRYKTRNPFEIADHLNNIIKYGDFMLRGFITSLLGFRKRTINQYLYKLECFFRYLHREGYSSINLRKSIPKINDTKER
ncbi:hypothetical protein [Sporomusa carbonis]|uniref:hypothetical protein n=1 Tax=Sporomusa carbonis TaxID=3076075 RepID=UPI003C7CD689